MGDLSPHFSRKEFACKCGCGFDTVDTRLLEILEGVRQYYDAQVKILSGCRCLEYNVKIGGSVQSQHMVARAADFIVKDTPATLVQRYLDLTYPDTLGLGSYTTFTHVDSRKGKARWQQSS